MPQGSSFPNSIPAYMYRAGVTPDPIHIDKFHCNHFYHHARKNYTCTQTPQTVSEPQVQHPSLSPHHLQARDSCSPWWHHQSCPVLCRECDHVGQICCHVEGDAHLNEASEELVGCVVEFRCRLNKGRCGEHWGGRMNVTRFKNRMVGDECVVKGLRQM